MKKQSGYILILALMLMSMSVLLISTVLIKSSMFSRYSMIYRKRDKAKALARSGVEIAISQLSNLLPEKEKDSEAEQENKGEDPKKEYYANLFSVINRWQVFKVNENDFDVVDSELKIYISCEQGKINIDQLYNFKKDIFISDEVNGLKFAEYLFSQLGQQVNQKKLLNAFEDFMKKRSYPLQDVSELLQAKKFVLFKQFLFNNPPERNIQEKTDKKNKIFHLMDIFTLETSSYKLDPLVLSESVCALLGFDRQSTIDGKKWVKDLPTGTVNWDSDWDAFLAPMYKKEYKTLSEEAKKLLTLQSDSLIFSVIVHANIGKLTQKMYAILHNDKKLNQYKIQKLYWL